MKSYICENIDQVRQKIDESAKKVGRNAKDVLLLAVSKTIDADRIQEAVDYGCNALGENRVQEILEKYDKITGNVKWHLIGHLQTNKVKYIIDKVEMIHSVESFKLAEEISKRAEQAGLTMDILIEVNMAEEESKFGIHESEVEDFIRQVSCLKAIRIRGLMTVAPFVENPEENRVYFRKMKKIMVDINGKKINNVSMDMLSMGMTGDYQIAVEEGATIVRVGTGIFGKRIYPGNK
ncbi:MAG: YggS family pyridoxal phosphate-dependent enzyme [Clostridiales bacterium]|nr:YggS family pyridoxal phosphate-dependent enzyme [Clostridiales bacterium]